MSARTAVITGANRGLGLAAARGLAQRGDRVVLTARTREQARAAVDRLRAEGLEAVHPAVLDVTLEASVVDFFAHLDADHGGRVDVLINNAGASFDPSGVGTLGIGSDVMLRSFEANALGAHRMMLRALPRMNAQRYGRVVNVSSGMGGIAEMDGGWPGYRVSKAALNAMTRVFHHEAQGDVKVNSVCPGWVRTDMGGPHATRSIDEGVAGILWAANLPAEGPSGGFFRDGEPTPW